MPPMCADAPPASSSYQNRPVGWEEDGEVERCFAGRRRRCDDSGLQGVSFPGTFPCSGRPTLPLEVNGSTPKRPVVRGVSKTLTVVEGVVVPRFDGVEKYQQNLQWKLTLDRSIFPNYLR